MSITEHFAVRAKSRAISRAVADKIIVFIMKELEAVEEDKQMQILHMVQSEIQTATKKE